MRTANYLLENKNDKIFKSFTEIESPFSYKDAMDLFPDPYELTEEEWLGVIKIQDILSKIMNGIIEAPPRYFLELFIEKYREEFNEEPDIEHFEVCILDYAYYIRTVINKHLYRIVK